MKKFTEMGEYKFKKDYSLLSNLKYYMRRFARQAEKHYKQKEAETNLAQKVFHGVSGAQELRFARILRTIIKELEKESLLVEAQVSDANGGKIMEVLYDAEKYYKNLLETDYENRDYSACWVCQIKLQLLDELIFDIDSRLSR